MRHNLEDQEDRVKTLTNALARWASVQDPPSKLGGCAIIPGDIIQVRDCHKTRQPCHMSVDNLLEFKSAQHDNCLDSFSHVRMCVRVYMCMHTSNIHTASRLTQFLAFVLLQCTLQSRDPDDSNSQGRNPSPMPTSTEPCFDGGDETQKDASAVIDEVIDFDWGNFFECKTDADRKTCGDSRDCCAEIAKRGIQVHFVPDVGGNPMKEDTHARGGRKVRLICYA